jgi:hypothetical protein
LRIKIYLYLFIAFSWDINLDFYEYIFLVSICFPIRNAPPKVIWSIRADHWYRNYFIDCSFWTILNRLWEFHDQVQIVIVCQFCWIRLWNAIDPISCVIEIVTLYTSVDFWTVNISVIQWRSQDTTVFKAWSLPPRSTRITFYTLW